MSPSWSARPSSPFRVVAELAAICAAYFLIRFFALPTFSLYHAQLSSLWQDIVVVPWTYIKTLHTFELGERVYTNPVHSAIGRACYRIQSQVLGISDEWGVFDADPSLHADQGADVVFIVYFTLITNSIWWCWCFYLKKDSILQKIADSAFFALYTQSLVWGVVWLCSTYERWKRTESQIKEHLE
ncbi:hypothetical protein V8F20_002158 [Naviculisporaceae sp. PSN 640]